MLLARQPSLPYIDEFLAAHGEAPFSYPDVGGTHGLAPPGFVVDRNRVRLGSGIFHRAAEAVRRWKMFDMDWLKIYPGAAPIIGGTTVAVLARHFGFWSLNPCRIVYVIDEPARFGFA